MSHKQEKYYPWVGASRSSSWPFASRLNYRKKWRKERGEKGRALTSLTAAEPWGRRKRNRVARRTKAIQNFSFWRFDLSVSGRRKNNRNRLLNHAEPRAPWIAIPVIAALDIPRGKGLSTLRRERERRVTTSIVSPYTCATRGLYVCI